MKRIASKLYPHQQLQNELHRTRKELQQLRLSFAEPPKRYLTDEALSHRYSESIRITCSYDAIHFCKIHFLELINRGLQEECHLLTLDASLKLIRTHQITVGLLNLAPLHPREVFRPAILDAAHSVILVHNHPSGESTPSQSDISLYKQLKEAGELLGIPVSDSIIVARSACVSISSHQ